MGPGPLVPASAAGEGVGVGSGSTGAPPSTAEGFDGAVGPDCGFPAQAVTRAAPKARRAVRESRETSISRGGSSCGNALEQNGQDVSE